MRTPILLLLTAIPITWAAASASARCLNYEPTQVSLEGELTTRTVPGPPGYVNIARGDHPETIVILVLETQICVNADPASSNNSKAHTQVTEVQLALENKPYRTLVGKRVRATGSLSAARSGHHRTPVILTTKALRGI